MDVELFRNNQSESGKMSLAGERGRWSGGGVWRRAGRGGVMSASGTGRQGEGGGAAETTKAGDFLLCGRGEEQGSGGSLGGRTGRRRLLEVGGVRARKHS